MNRILKLPLSLADAVRSFLNSKGFEEERNPNVLLSFRGENLKVVLYPNGTLLVQGKGNAEGLIDELVNSLRVESGYIGTDEAGKGDLFGPLVVCGCAVKTEEVARKFLKLGVRDSKNLPSRSLEEVAKALKEFDFCRCLVIKPEVYNKLYAEFQNQNKILSLAHANLLDALYLETALKRAVVDRFMKGSYIDCFLNAPLRVEETVGAERYLGVAAASVLARYLFLKELERLSKIVGEKLPAGSGNEAKRVFQKLRTKFERKVLERVAKLHFKV